MPIKQELIYILIISLLPPFIFLKKSMPARKKPLLLIKTPYNCTDLLINKQQYYHSIVLFPMATLSNMSMLRKIELHRDANEFYFLCKISKVLSENPNLLLYQKKQGFQIVFGLILPEGNGDPMQRKPSKTKVHLLHV